MTGPNTPPPPPPPRGMAGPTSPPPPPPPPPKPWQPSGAARRQRLAELDVLSAQLPVLCRRLDFVWARVERHLAEHVGT